MNTIRERIADAKRRLSMPELLRRLNLEQHARKSARCPLHKDSSPSFSVWQGTAGWHWKCHAGCGEGDEINFVAVYHGITRADALQRFFEMAGGSPFTLPRSVQSFKPRRVVLPEDAIQGDKAHYDELAALRRISWHAPFTAARVLGTLYFGTVCGCRSWIVTDESRLCAEARRMDGRLFPAVGELKERKAHTIRGSSKNWPVGLAVRRFAPAEFRAILCVEGGPDYLAALDFTLAESSDCLPIAFLGAGVGSAIHPRALPHFRGMRVRSYPHCDPGKQGDAAAVKWARQFAEVGAIQDAFDFAGIRKADGSVVSDLNDCTQLHPDDAAELTSLLP